MGRVSIILLHQDHFSGKCLFSAAGQAVEIDAAGQTVSAAVFSVAVATATLGVRQGSFSAPGVGLEPLCAPSMPAAQNHFSICGCDPNPRVNGISCFRFLVLASVGLGFSALGNTPTLVGVGVFRYVVGNGGNHLEIAFPACRTSGFMGGAYRRFRQRFRAFLSPRDGFGEVGFSLLGSLASLRAFHA